MKVLPRFSHVFVIFAYRAYEDEDKKTGEKSISWKHQSSEEESEGTESEEENPQLRSSAVLNFKHSESWGFQATGVTADIQKLCFLYEFTRKKRK